MAYLFHRAAIKSPFYIQLSFAAAVIETCQLFCGSQNTKPTIGRRGRGVRDRWWLAGCAEWWTTTWRRSPWKRTDNSSPRRSTASLCRSTTCIRTWRHCRRHSSISSKRPASYNGPFTRYNLLSIRLSNRLSKRFANRLYRVYKHSTGCQTGLTTGWMFVYTIQPVVNPVVQPVLSCKRGFTVNVWHSPATALQPLQATVSDTEQNYNSNAEGNDIIWYHLFIMTTPFNMNGVSGPALWNLYCRKYYRSTLFGTP